MKTKTRKETIDMFVVAPGVWGMKDVFVNLYVINNSAENNWWLVDTGVGWTGSKIKSFAEILFGAGSRPAAIILTHGHFDHVGSLRKLAEEWDVPVYAHHLEVPYLSGISAYPPTDPSVGGGLMADLSFLYPKGPINIADRLVSLPQGGKIPGLPDWEYLHTPGHAPGHISLYRSSDKVLISGDAVVTTKAESALSTIFQFRKISGPPKYFTSDWLSAASSVQLLANLDPEIVASGHGRPMRGETMRKSLHNLAREFQSMAVPAKGRYTFQPALMDDSGVVHIPPKNPNSSAAPTLKLLGIAAGVLITLMLFKSSKSKKIKNRLKKEEQKAEKAAKKGIDKFEVKTEAKKLKAPVEKKLNKAEKAIDKVDKEFDREKPKLEKKARKIVSKIETKAGKVKKPALHLFDSLKFKVNKRLK